MGNQTGLIRLLARFRGALLAMGLFTACINLLMLAIPFYMMNVYSRVLSSRSMETLVLLTLITTGALLLQGVLLMIRSNVLSRIGILLDTGLSGTILTTIVREAASSGRRNIQGLRDLNELRNFLTGPSILALFDAPFAPVYVVFIYFLHPTLGLLALVSCLLLFGLGYCNELFTRRSLKATNEASALAMNQADGFARNADAIEAMGMMPAIIARWGGNNTRTLKALQGATDRADFFNATAKFLRLLIQTTIYGIGAYLFIRNELMAGAMFAAAILMSRALAPVESAIGTWKNLISVRAAYSRLKQTLNQANTSANALSLPTPEGHLTVERILAVAPGSDRITLKGISFDLVPGEFLGIIGPSGAGKTSLARILIGIAQPRAGVVRLDGANIHDWHPDELGRHIGYLPQDVQLFAGTVADNIARMGLEVSSEAVVAAARMAGVHHMILRLPKGYDTEIGDGGLGLSAGQRQHIGLARVLFGNPRLIVLDEPNSNLDTLGEQALVQALAAAKAKGITLVVITHRPSILKTADKMLVLREGAVEQYGPRDEIMAKMTQPTPLPNHAGRRPEKKGITATEQKPVVAEQKPAMQAEHKPAVVAERRPAAVAERRPAAVAEPRPAIRAKIEQSTVAPIEHEPTVPTVIERLFSERLISRSTTQ